MRNEPAFVYFYLLCFVKRISMGVLEERKRKERDTNLKVEEDIIISDSREKHWKDFL